MPESVKESLTRRAVFSSLFSAPHDGDRGGPQSVDLRRQSYGPRFRHLTDSAEEQLHHTPPTTSRPLGSASAASANAHHRYRTNPGSALPMDGVPGQPEPGQQQHGRDKVRE